MYLYTYDVVYKFGVSMGNIGLIRCDQVGGCGGGGTCQEIGRTRACANTRGRGRGMVVGWSVESVPLTNLIHAVAEQK